jgi:ribose transport system permease protein
MRSLHLPSLRSGGAVGLMAFVALSLCGAITVDGFAGSLSVRSMLLFGSFLGIAAIGQTLCALVGALDLSIPFVIGAANIGTLWLIGKGLPAGLAIVVVLLLAGVVGALNGLISFSLPGQALIVTLGVGFGVQAGAQIVTSSGSETSGTVYGQVPQWLVDTASVNGRTAGVGVPPAVVFWLLLTGLVVLLLRRTWFGRGLYAMGGNRVAARLTQVPELRNWVVVFAISAVTAAIAGVLLLGFSGGGFADAGQPYLFTTVAAVVIGGTSLLGGRGGYGLTVLGVAVLTVLTTVLVGLGLSTAGQQAILGLIIVPMVALYGRAPHPRTQI